MRSHPKRHPFARSDLETQIDPALKYHFLAILREWNQVHPDKLIYDNGRDRNKRRYFLR
jgi:hypothetical protein